MTSYNTDLTRLKRALSTSRSTWDTELQEQLDAAYTYINQKLDKYTSVPLASPGDLILHIEVLLAVGWFRMTQAEEEDEEVKGRVVLAEAKKLLEEYIQDNYVSGDTGNELLSQTGWHNYTENSWSQDIDDNWD